MLNVFMLSVTNKPFMLNVIMLNGIMLSFVALNVVCAHTNGPDKLDCQITVV